MSLFACLVLGASAFSYVACQFDVLLYLLSLILAVFSNWKASFCYFRRYSHVTLEMEIYIISPLFLYAN